jgi:hypothetical protein
MYSACEQLEIGNIKKIYNEKSPRCLPPSIVQSMDVLLHVKHGSPKNQIRTTMGHTSNTAEGRR